MTAAGRTLVQYVARGIHADLTSGSGAWDELDVSALAPEPGPYTDGCGFTVSDTTGLTGDGTVEVIIRRLP